MPRTAQLALLLSLVSATAEATSPKAHAEKILFQSSAKGAKNKIIVTIPPLAKIPAERKHQIFLYGRDSLKEIQGSWLSVRSVDQTSGKSRALTKSNADSWSGKWGSSVSVVPLKNLKNVVTVREIPKLLRNDPSRAERLVITRQGDHLRAWHVHEDSSATGLLAHPFNPSRR